MNICNGVGCFFLVIVLYFRMLGLFFVGTLFILFSLKKLKVSKKNKVFFTLGILFILTNWFFLNNQADKVRQIHLDNAAQYDFDLYLPSKLPIEYSVKTAGAAPNYFYYELSTGDDGSNDVSVYEYKVTKYNVTEGSPICSGGDAHPDLNQTNIQGFNPNNASATCTVLSNGSIDKKIYISSNKPGVSINHSYYIQLGSTVIATSSINSQNKSEVLLMFNDMELADKTRIDYKNIETPGFLAAHEIFFNYFAKSIFRLF